ncbi:hypothetical protein ACFQU1_01165 [Chelatococcus sp. GCM10030263]|uniref:hypothetical protein n=1 Tax=Chelatococcus sp. GCM10030263 TaxID=3273387 RepID=UPI003620FFFA
MTGDRGYPPVEVEDVEEPSEFTRVADALAQARASERRIATDRPPTLSQPTANRPPPAGRRAAIRRESRRRVYGGIFALGLVAAALGAWLTVEFLDKRSRTNAVLQDEATLDYRLKPTPAVDALGRALPIWVGAEQSALLLTSPAPELADLDVSYQAWQHGLGGRRDIAAFGHFDVGPYLFLAFYWPGEEAETAPSFFVDMVRQAAEAGISVVRTDLSVGRRTKYGMMEIAQGVLTDGSGQRSCYLFRHRAADRGVKLSGWACGTPELPLDPASLICAIDQTRFVARDDEALAALLAEADKNRTPACSAPATSDRSRAANRRS